MKIRKPWKSGQTAIFAATGILSATLVASLPNALGQELPTSLSWKTVVNNLDDIPGTAVKFNSYNQPSVNGAGYLVFRARSKGADHVSGIFTRNMAGGGSPIMVIANRETPVPAPNNTTYPPDDLLSAFLDFPSIPRIAAGSQVMATRGNSRPTWTYQDGADESRAGTTGIFVNPGGLLQTGVNILGALPEPVPSTPGVDYFPYFRVPGLMEATKFDVFPGSPSVTDQNVIAFKGNYTDMDGKTGVFFRDLLAQGGLAPVELVANSDTTIPNLPIGVSGIPFDSTAPPSAHDSEMVFVGYDNEDDPTYGGIYLAPLTPNPPLTTLVGVGDPVPDEMGETFTQFGEALSFDGRYVAFWAAWGEETKTLWLDCPAHGNQDLIDYCMNHVGDDFPVRVPVHQGVFVHDTDTGQTLTIAKTGDGIDDFLYWHFSGHPPGTGSGDETDGEPPRWRASAFVSVADTPSQMPFVAFKARSGMIDPVEKNYLDPIDGIYLGNGTEYTTLLDTTMDGQTLDPEAPVGSVIAELAIEREGFRKTWLAVSAVMEVPAGPTAMDFLAVEEEEAEGLSGIYLARMPWAPRTYRPDLRIGKKKNVYTHKGNNEYYEDGSKGTHLRIRSRSKSAVFYVSVENDGDAVDGIRLGSRESGKRKIDARFSIPGSGNVTAQMRTNHWLAGYEVGQIRLLRARIKTRALKANRTVKFGFLCSSVNDPSKFDMNNAKIKFRLKRSRTDTERGETVSGRAGFGFGLKPPILRGRGIQ